LINASPLCEFTAEIKSLINCGISFLFVIVFCFCSTQISKLPR
jgi:hypothetical protein